MMDDAEKEALKAEIKNEILKELKAEGAESFSWTDAARGAKLRPFLLAKQSEEKKQVLNFRMEKGYLDVLDLWAEKRGIKTRTAALKAMILELGDD